MFLHVETYLENQWKRCNKNNLFPGEEIETFSVLGRITYRNEAMGTCSYEIAGIQHAEIYDFLAAMVDKKKVI